jgi:preprotein translocase subunit Sec63
VNYVIAGYSIVLGLLFLYAVQLIWRRRRLNRLVALAEADVAPDERAQDGP